MDRRNDMTFDERPDGLPRTAGATRPQSLLHGGEDGLRLREDP